MAYGQVNADVIGTSVVGSNLGAGNASIMKNRIINGSMTIDQRNAGASVAVTSSNYSVDRWFGQASQTSKFTLQQNAGSVTPPAGFTNYLGATSSSAYSVGSGDYFSLNQKIEGFNTADLGWGTANAKTVTLSFQAYSSLTGTFGGVLANSAGTRSYPFTYSIPVANTWTSISITIAGDTTGTWLTTNGVGINIQFGLGVGSTYSGTAGSWAGANYVSATGATSVVGTSSATFYITGVQLEVGSSATGFEYVNYQTSLANCQRYYQSINAANSAQAYNSFANGFVVASTYAFFQYPMLSSMRTAPTLLNAAVGQYRVSFNTCTALAISSASPNAVSIRADSTGLTTGYGCELDANNNNTAYLALSAEL